MREKIAIANQMRISRKNYSNNIEHKRICTKCYHTFLLECIIKRNDSFSLSYGEKYIQSFSKRLLDWVKYIWNVIYRFFLITFIPKNDKTIKNYELIHFGASKPLHLKIAEIPDEQFLNYFLKKNGFKIKEEHLSFNSIIYEVART